MMKYVKYAVITVFCLLLLAISGRITRTLAYGLANPNEFKNCVYPERSPKQSEAFHAGETGVLKKHVCLKY